MYLTERLVIEPIHIGHANGLHAALDDPHVGTFIGGPDVTTIEALRDRITRLIDGPSSWWNFVALHDDIVIGRVEATTDEGWGEVAYVFGPRWWGRGLATEALQWLVAHLADNGIPELWAAVHRDNERSIRLAERVGFTQRPAPSRPVLSYEPGVDVILVRHHANHMNPTAF